MNQSNLAQYFEEVAEKVKSKGSGAKDADLLKFYGLYKQATIGDCNTAEPYFYQAKEKAKWNAWNANKGKSQEDAKAEYVQFAMDFLPDDEKSKYQS